MKKIFYIILFTLLSSSVVFGLVRIIPSDSIYIGGFTNIDSNLSTTDLSGTYWKTAYGLMWTETYITDARWTEPYNTEIP